MASAWARHRTKERLLALADSGLPSEELRRDAIAQLQPAIGFSRWCAPLCDPLSLLPSSGIANIDYFKTLPRAIELDESDVMSKAAIAQARRPVLTLSEATGGDLARSRRWDECMREYGVGDTLLAACRDDHGTWGWLEFHRDHGDRPFDADDMELLEVAAAAIAAGLRRSLLADDGGGRRDQLPTAMTVLDASLQPTSWTPGARAWLDVMPSAQLYSAWGIPPTWVTSVGARARAVEGADTLPARVVLRTVDGRWAIAEAAPLEGAAATGSIAMTLREAGAAEVLDLATRAYGLTPRERELVRLITEEGLDTRALAERMFISRYTVQDHLKAVFEKVGVRSRAELVAALGA
jgi:DNA-binding CsgD family transcriptional regulator